MKKPSWKGKKIKIPKTGSTVDRLKELREKEYEKSKEKRTNTKRKD